MICFLRHADGTGQAPEAPLSDAGQRAADAAVPLLSAFGIKSVWTSPYLRARQTVRPFAEEGGFDLRVDERLREREHGAVPPGGWDDEAEQLFSDREARPHGGESIADVAARSSDTIAEIRAASDRPLLATRGFWLSVALARYGRLLNIASWRAMPRPALFVVDRGGLREQELCL